MEILIADYLATLNPAQVVAFYAETEALRDVLRSVLHAYFASHPTNAGPWLAAHATTMVAHGFCEGLHVLIAGLAPHAPSMPDQEKPHA